MNSSMKDKSYPPYINHLLEVLNKPNSKVMFQFGRAQGKSTVRQIYLETLDKMSKDKITEKDVE